MVLINLFLLLAPRPFSEVQAAELTSQQADVIVSELRQIRGLLEKQQASIPLAVGTTSPSSSETAKIPLRNHFSLGSDDAPLTLVQFVDHQCPACNRFHLTTFPDLKKNYIDTGKVRFISRNLPLEFPPHAFRAAQAARCAGEQDHYWQLRDVLSSNPKQLHQEAILAYAQEQALNMQKFRACFESNKYGDEIQADIADAHGAGINGTPGFKSGRVGGDSGAVFTSGAIFEPRPFSLPGTQQPSSGSLDPQCIGESRCRSTS